MNVIIKQQKKNTDWTDEAGITIPYSQIKKKEKVFEEVTYKAATRALKIHSQLAGFKSYLSTLLQLAIDAFHAEYKGKKTVFKGNYTVYNFDQSIKLDVKVSNPIKFDDMTIQRAKDLLDKFLNSGIKAKNGAIKQMVMDAFETTRGKMDVKKIMGLKKYADRVKDKRYTEAMQLIDRAIRRPSTATYFHVWIRDQEGKYKAVALNIADL